MVSLVGAIRCNWLPVQMAPVSGPRRVMLVTVRLFAASYQINEFGAVTQARVSQLFTRKIEDRLPPAAMTSVSGR
jgi:hypothetical protein